MALVEKLMMRPPARRRVAASRIVRKLSFTLMSNRRSKAASLASARWGSSLAAIGMSTACRIRGAAPQPRTMEFHKRLLHPGAAIGRHPLSHDEVYCVRSGEGEVRRTARRGT